MLSTPEGKAFQREQSIARKEAKAASWAQLPVRRFCLRDDLSSLVLHEHAKRFQRVRKISGIMSRYAQMMLKNEAGNKVKKLA